jgi:N-acetylglutamate synthase-like GNAT family acetyltransferase
MAGMTIRRAHAEEAEVLSALCRRSKAHWGYDADFMRLSEAALTINPDFIASGRVLVAEDRNDKLLGVASVAPTNEQGLFDLVHLFVEPGLIGSGVGRTLFHAAAALAKQHSAARLSILADPFAADFYRRMGAKDIGKAPSDSIPGRKLPLLEFIISDAPRLRVNLFFSTPAPCPPRPARAMWWCRIAGRGCLRV